MTIETINEAYARALQEITALKAEIERKDEALVAVELLIRNDLRNGYSSYELGRAKEIIDQALHIKEVE